MSADLLREAARTMRERAQGARVGPWVSEPDAEMWANPIVCGPEYPAEEEGETHRFVIAECYGFNKPENAAYIASMHPAVALAMAEWLDDTAAGWPWDADEPEVVDWDGDRITFAESVDSRALAVARAYLGRAS